MYFNFLPRLIKATHIVFKFGAGLITAIAYVLYVFPFVYSFGFVLMEKLLASDNDKDSWCQLIELLLPLRMISGVSLRICADCNCCGFKGSLVQICDIMSV
nr:hypothetical protein CFP56_08684 [Quercus suber]